MPKLKASPHKTGPRWEWSNTRVVVITIIACGSVIYGFARSNLFPFEYERIVPDPESAWPAALNTVGYNARMLALAHYIVPVVATATISTNISITSLPHSTATTSVSISGKLWPKATIYPQGGAILPFNRIIAYYGNFYSTQMGVLGQYPPSQVLAMLASTTAQWAVADPTTPVIPAIQYIAVVAQGSAGADDTYRARMPDSQINQALQMANDIHGLLILDVQVGESTLQKELSLLQKYLSKPNVELAIDPEFSMKSGNRPGTVIGTYDATDINYAAQYLASLVQYYHLPPKVLIVHRFTYSMVTNYQNIAPLPEVQIVMDMDGWGSQEKKIGTYNAVIAPFPVQFTGLKLFYKNDLLPPSLGMLSPQQILALTPSPIYIQYQ